MINWKTCTVLVQDLKPWDKNPRTITEKEFKKLTTSMDELGNFSGIVCDIDLTVISGNQRLEYYKSRDAEEIQVMIPDRALTSAERDRIGLLSNSHAGAWDFDLLYNTFDEILLEEINITPVNSPELEEPTKPDSSLMVYINCDNKDEQLRVYEELAKLGYNVNMK